MIRIRRLELNNFKNVHHGAIGFKDTKNGSCIAGIYGQNGSGKTAVVEALACVRGLVVGAGLPQNSVDYVGPFERNASISVEVEFTRTGKEKEGCLCGVFPGSEGSLFVGYSVAFGPMPDGVLPESLDVASVSGISLLSEVLTVRASGLNRRTLFGFTAIGDNPGGSLAPAAKWATIRSLVDEDARLGLMLSLRDAVWRGKSALFSIGALRAIAAAFDVLVGEKTQDSHQAAVAVADNLSGAARIAGQEVVVPLAGIVTQLSYFARTKLTILDTSRSAYIALNLVPVSRSKNKPYGLTAFTTQQEPQDIMLDIDKACVISDAALDALRTTMDAINQVLVAIIPGLTLEVSVLHAETLDDGQIGKRVEVLSCRRDARVPFRMESEGIKKIVSMLSLLIDVYNDESSCLVVDELDSGVFEFLLGEILEVIAEHGCGQLVFTAHNLRPLECLSASSLLFTTVNPDNRYIHLKGIGASNNMRNQYLRALNLGGQKEHVYDPTDSLDIDAAFYDAGHPNVGDAGVLFAEAAGLVADDAAAGGESRVNA